MKREKAGDGAVFGWGCLIAILGFVVFVGIVIVLGMRSMIRVYTSFGDKEMEIINQRLGITIKGSTTPVKLKWIRGRDPDYELWLENIDDPEEFMENCYDGTYSVVENKSDLIEFGEKEISASYDYNSSLTAGSSYIIYNCDRYFEYNIAFYKDGESFKAKVYADDR
ncbi:hypothetical protein [Ruminococcus albus]|uniref:Uncharacterized protein n=1 Tax=Ruminococcus albus TaxID=1264 RepID=A0A1H7PT66_RUMAL|nr:hypothetical protein [Ruminococcus albus]SEL39020.1 hypothetical protein SAMN05216469_1258 [Ruminococcus albus]